MIGVSNTNGIHIHGRSWAASKRSATDAKLGRAATAFLALMLVFPFSEGGELVGALTQLHAPAATHSLERAPAALRRAATAALDRDGYAVRQAADDEHALVAANAAQGFDAQFSRSGATLRPKEASAGWILSMSLAAVEHGDKSVGLRSALPTLAAGRVELDHGVVTEWYENRPQGLEQGFDVPRPPVEGGVGKLRLSLSIAGGLVPRLVDDGKTVSLTTEGSDVLTYDKLLVVDAAGKRVPAHLEVDGSDISLVVDARSPQYPLTIDPLIAAEQAKVTASDGAASDAFGATVAIDGDTALVGAPNVTVKSVKWEGAAYVFVRTGGVWTEQAKLVADDAGVQDSSGFGASVAVSGDTALIGAPADESPVYNAGSAYVFRRSGSAWTQEAKLSASDAVHGANFGQSVDLDGDTAVMGAPYDDTPLADQGAAYVFSRANGRWTQEAKLQPADAASGDIVGRAVAISGNVVVAGAAGDDVAFENAGSASVFARSEGVWREGAKLTAPDGAKFDNLGSSVAISGSTVVAGAPHDDTPRLVDAGSAYVFERSGASWARGPKLVAGDAGDVEWFGSSLAVDGDALVVGASNDSSRVDFWAHGSGYVFERSGTSWLQQTKITASDRALHDHFAHSVSLSRGTAIVGAPDDDSPLADAGSAYVFEIAAPNTPPVADGLAVTAEEDGAATIDLSATDRDGDDITFDIASLPSRGTLHRGDSPSGDVISAPGPVPGARVTYVPAPDFNGNDTFGFTALDATSRSGIATVAVDVEPINDAPVARDFVYELPAGASTAVVELNLLANDLETPHSALSYELVPPLPPLGSATLDGAVLTYTVGAEENGTQSIVYRVEDRGDPTACGDPEPPCAASTFASGTVAIVDPDVTPPAVVGAGDRLGNDAGWHNADVRIRWDATDASGVASQPTPTLADREGRDVVYTSDQSCDGSANCAVGTVSLSIDKTPPTIIAAAAPAPDSGGWRRGEVLVTFECEDALSGVAFCPRPVALTGDGAAQEVTGTAADVAGNEVTITLGDINIDRGAPSITAVVAPAPNANGWYASTPVVTFACEDDVSGVSTCTPPTTVTGEGRDLSVVGEATDRAGNTATITVAGIHVDGTTPTVVYNGNRGTYAADETITITCTAADAVSGIARHSCADISGPAHSFAVGANSFTADAVDVAGNQTSSSVSFTVVVTPAAVGSVIDQLVHTPKAAAQLRTSLDKLIAAQGDPKKEAKALESFEKSLDAEIGRTLTLAEASRIKALAREI